MRKIIIFQNKMKKYIKSIYVKELKENKILKKKVKYKLYFLLLNINNI